METLKPMVSGIPLVIFSKSSCCSCYGIKAFFVNFGAKIVVHELDQISGGWEIEQALSELGCSPTVVPAVFIGGELVGGVNEINSLHLQQKLIPKLKRAGAIWL